MTAAALAPQTMQRLAFIRLLHQQGTDQSRLPEPLNFTCVLILHDAIELFLMLTAEHLGISVKEKDPFVLRYFDGLHPRNNNGQGVDLSGRNGVKRLTDLRNAFKHANTWPGPQGIEQSRTDAASFFDENTPKVFGLAYADIDMADLIPQGEIRDLVKTAAVADSSGKRIDAMALLIDAAEALFRDRAGQGRDRSPFSFGPNLPLPLPLPERDIARLLRTHQDRDGNAGRLAEQITKLTDITLAAQRALRIITAGIDYHTYLKFLQITPIVNYSINGERFVRHPDAYAPSAEDFAYGQQFVITAALRMADIQIHLTPPS
jgi:hypothetical protein